MLPTNAPTMITSVATTTQAHTHRAAERTVIAHVRRMARRDERTLAHVDAHRAAQSGAHVPTAVLPRTVFRPVAGEGDFFAFARSCATFAAGKSTADVGQCAGGLATLDGVHRCVRVSCASVRPSVRSSIRPSVRPSVRSRVRSSVRPSVRPRVRPSVDGAGIRTSGVTGPVVVAACKCK